MRGRWTEATAALRAELHVGPRVNRSPRGVALLLVLMVLAIVSAFAAEFHYKSYIRLHAASNMREDVAAYYHARSAMEIARMVIKSQKLADNFLRMVPTAQRPHFELWTLACEFANAFCTGDLKLMGKSFFNFKGLGGVGLQEGGMCRCRAFPEDGRVNINRVDSDADRTRMFMELYRELDRHEPKDDTPPTGVVEFDEQLAEKVLNIIDYVDPDKSRSDLVEQRAVVSSSQGEGSSGSLTENKNAKFDTLQELMMVEGIEPELFCKMQQELTPYSTKKLNVNTASLHTLRSMLCDPSYTSNWQEACYMPGTGQQILPLPSIDWALGCLDVCREVRKTLMSPGFARVDQFIKFFQSVPPSLGVAPALSGQKVRQTADVKSKIIRIETVGGSFGTYRGLTGVLDTSSGDYIYWREY